MNAEFILIQKRLKYKTLKPSKQIMLKVNNRNTGFEIWFEICSKLRRE